MPNVVKGVHTVEEANAVWNAPVGVRDVERALRTVRQCDCENGRVEYRDGLNKRHWRDCHCRGDAKALHEAWWKHQCKVNPSVKFERKLMRARKRTAQEQLEGQRVSYDEKVYVIDKVRIRDGWLEYLFRADDDSTMWIQRLTWCKQPYRFRLLNPEG